MPRIRPLAQWLPRQPARLAIRQEASAPLALLLQIAAAMLTALKVAGFQMVTLTMATVFFRSRSLVPQDWSGLLIVSSVYTSSCMLESLVVVPNVDAGCDESTERHSDRDSRGVPRPHFALAVTPPLPYRYSSSP
jgi:hypothetical protein